MKIDNGCITGGWFLENFDSIKLGVIGVDNESIKTLKSCKEKVVKKYPHKYLIDKQYSLARLVLIKVEELEATWNLQF